MDVRIRGNSLIVNPDKSLQGKPASEVLDSSLLLPPAYRKQLFREGRVKQGREVLDPDALIKAGHRIALEGGIENDSDWELSEVEGFTNVNKELDVPDLDVLYEDDHLLIVNKPAPLLVYPGSDSDSDTLDARVLHYFQQNGLHRRVYHVHRLDRDTSGAILYAKHAYSARALDSLLAQRQIHRRYLALVRGALHPVKGVIDNPIGRDRHVSGRYRVSKTGKEALTEYITLGTCRVVNEPVTLVECQLQTGRTHQIRVHMSSRGCPVVGDRLYGGGNGVGEIRFEQGHALHAWRLSFKHPYTEQEISVSANLPAAFQEALIDLDLDRALHKAKE